MNKVGENKHGCDGADEQDRRHVRHASRRFDILSCNKLWRLAARTSACGKSYRVALPRVTDSHDGTRVK